MKPTLASYLDLLTPWISPDLISAPYLNRIHQIAARLPVLSFGSFECWLDANEPRVDFNVAINPRINEHITVRDWSQEEAQFESDAYREMRERIRAFCALRSQKDFFLEPLLGDFCLVFDINDLHDLSPIPWVYICFLKNFLDDDRTIKSEIISKVLPLVEEGLPTDLIEKFRHIIHTIPTSIYVGPIGILKRNKKTSFRLFLGIGTFEEVIKVLQTLHWSGDLEEFRAVIEPWINSPYSLGLALDFDGTIQPKIGIEVNFRPGHFQEELSWFTEKLCEQGLCSIAKRNAILDWNGTFEVETPPTFWSWPNQVLENPERIPEKIVIRRITSHIKLIFESNKPLVAKVYPMFFRTVT